MVVVGWVSGREMVCPQSYPALSGLQRCAMQSSKCDKLHSFGESHAWAYGKNSAPGDLEAPCPLSLRVSSFRWFDLSSIGLTFFSSEQRCANA